MAADVHTNREPRTVTTALHAGWHDVSLRIFLQAFRQRLCKENAHDHAVYCIMIVSQSLCLSSSTGLGAESRRQPAAEGTIASVQVDKGANKQLLLPRLSSPWLSIDLSDIAVGSGLPPLPLSTCARGESMTVLPNGCNWVCGPRKLTLRPASCHSKQRPETGADVSRCEIWALMAPESDSRVGQVFFSPPMRCVISWACFFAL